MIHIEVIEQDIGLSVPYLSFKTLKFLFRDFVSTLLPTNLDKHQNTSKSTFLKQLLLYLHISKS